MSTAPPPAPPHTVDTDAGLVAYHDVGDGPAVLLLHGFPASSWQWREFLPVLATRFRVVAPDLPGAGASIPPDGAVLDLACHADAVRALLEHLGIDRVAIVAHGVGAGVAQLLAIDDPGTDALVLLNAAAFDTWPSASLAEARDRIEAEGAGPGLVGALVREAFDRGAVQRGRLGAELVEAYAHPYVTGDGPRRFAQVVRGLDGRGLLGREAALAAIEAPTLILWGEDDPVYPPEVAERLNEAMPASTLGLLPGCGHFLVEEAGETIGPMIAEYLRARYAHAPHGHGDPNAGIVMLQLERRPPWVDLEDDERDDWFRDDDEPDEREGSRP